LKNSIFRKINAIRTLFNFVSRNGKVKSLVGVSIYIYIYIMLGPTAFLSANFHILLSLFKIIYLIKKNIILDNKLGLLRSH